MNELELYQQQNCYEFKGCIGKQVMFRKDHMDPARENLVGYFRQGYFLETSTLINQPQTYERGKYNTTGGYQSMDDCLKIHPHGKDADVFNAKDDSKCRQRWNDIFIHIYNHLRYGEEEGTAASNGARMSTKSLRIMIMTETSHKMIRRTMFRQKMMKLMDHPERVLSLRGSSRRGQLQLIPAALQSEKKKRTKRRVLLVVFPIVSTFVGHSRVKECLRRR